MKSIKEEEIESLYPEAFKKFDNFIDYLCANDELSYTDKEFICYNFGFNTPVLYEFFDSQNLFISVLRFGEESEIQDSKWWMYIITDLDLDSEQICYVTRLEAEQAAFEKAFEILNNRL